MSKEGTLFHDKSYREQNKEWILEHLGNCEHPGNACDFCVETGHYYQGAHPENLIAEELCLAGDFAYSLLCELRREDKVGLHWYPAPDYKETGHQERWWATV